MHVFNLGRSAVTAQPNCQRTSKLDNRSKDTVTSVILVKNLNIFPRQNENLELVNEVYVVYGTFGFSHIFMKTTVTTLQVIFVREDSSVAIALVTS